MPKYINFKHGDALLNKVFEAIHGYDLAQIYPTLDEVEKKRLVHLIDDEKLALMFVELSVEHQESLLKLLSEIKIKRLLQSLESDDLKEFIESLEKDRQTFYYKYLTKERIKTVKILMAYEKDQAASMMSTNYLTVHLDMTVKEATNLIVTTSKDNDYIDFIYVLDQDKKWVGTLDIKDLIIARPSQLLKNVIQDDTHFIYANESIEKAIDLVQDYDQNALPVLNDRHELIGIITADDIFDELTDDYDEDYQKLAALSDHNSSLTALERSKQRMPWLLIAVCLNLLTVSILSSFEHTLEAVTVLVLFQPMILGMAGNIGTQSLAVTILGLHKDELLNKKTQQKHILKEISIGLFNSIILGVLAFVIAYIVVRFISQSDQNPIYVGEVVGVSLGIAMSISSMMGVIVPLTLNKLKIDPASASGPMMTTLNDIISLVLYFSIATYMFL